MRVFVTGGTGFIGREVVRQLVKCGHSVSCLVRVRGRIRTTDTREGEGPRYVTGDLLDATSLAPLLAGHDAVIHLVGIISETRKVDFETIHVRATEQVVLAARQAGIRRFAHMSALGSRPGAASRYHQTKWRAEELVRAGGFDLTVFRPSIVYGREDQFVNMFHTMARRLPFVPVVGTGKGLFQPIPVELVARCFVLCLETEASVGQTYDLGGREVLTLVNIVDQILAVSHLRRFKLFVPLWAAKVMAGMMELVLGSVLGWPPPLNRDQLIMLEEKTVGDVEPAWRDFGIAPPQFAAGIARFLGAEQTRGV